MRVGWMVLSILLGVMAALALLRVIEKAVTATLSSQAGVQLLMAVVLGFFAFKAWSKARTRS